jgi:hypothetical protein
MKIVLLEIENFRGIETGIVPFGNHTVLVFQVYISTDLKILYFTNFRFSWLRMNPLFCDEQLTLKLPGH